MSLLSQDGRLLKCPHDKKDHPVSNFNVFSRAGYYLKNLNIVVRCKTCGHIFSPLLDEREKDLISDFITNANLVT